MSLIDSVCVSLSDRECVSFNDSVCVCVTQRLCVYVCVCVPISRQQECARPHRLQRAPPSQPTGNALSRCLSVSTKQHCSLHFDLSTASLKHCKPAGPSLLQQPAPAGRRSFAPLSFKNGKLEYLGPSWPHPVERTQGSLHNHVKHDI